MTGKVWIGMGGGIHWNTQMGMKLYGGLMPDDNTYISVTALNVGDRPTTITNLGGMYFDSWWRAYVLRRQPKQAFNITEPSQAQRIPYRFEVGQQWIGMAIQSDEITEMAQDGYLFLILYTANGGKGYRIRIRSRLKKHDTDSLETTV